MFTGLFFGSILKPNAQTCKVNYTTINEIVTAHQCT